MPAVDNGFLLGPAKDVLGELHQEESLAIRIEDIGQTLSLVLEEVANTGTGHQVEVLVVAHLFRVLKANTMLDTPLFIANKETLLDVLVIVAVFQDELMQFGELCIAVNKDFQHEILFLLTE